MNLDDDLLSHGEAPHYHRRCIVSLLSSGWDQVVPMLYGRQEILLPEDPDGYSSQFGYVNLWSYELSGLSSSPPQSGLGTNCLGVIWSSLTGN